MPKTYALVCLPLLLATHALAVGNVTCSSADRRVSVTRSYPDGGAFFRPTQTITLDGVVVYRASLTDETGIRTAEPAWTDRKELSFQAMAGRQPQVRVYAEKLTLTDRTSGQVSFADFVICRDVSRPCPLCP